MSRARAADAAPLVPLAVMIWAAARGQPPSWCAWAMLALVLAVLIANPLGALDSVLAPGGRTLLASGLVEIVVGGLMRTMDPLGRAMIVIVGIGSILLGFASRRKMLERWEAKQAAIAEQAEEREYIDTIMQSPEVDKVLGELTAQATGNAGEAWSEFGLRQTRALLHQSLNFLASDEQIRTFCLPVWLLAYAHALADREAINKLHAAETARLENEIANLRKQIRALRAQVAEYEEAGAQIAQQEIMELGAQCSAYQHMAHKLQEQLRQLTAQTAAPEPEPPETMEDRDSLILAAVEGGRSYAEAGAIYGLSKGGAYAACQRAKKAAASAGNTDDGASKNDTVSLTA